MPHWGKTTLVPPHFHSSFAFSFGLHTSGILALDPSLKLHSLLKASHFSNPKQLSRFHSRCLTLMQVHLLKQLSPYRSYYWVDLIEPVTAEVHGFRILACLPRLNLHVCPSNISKVTPRFKLKYGFILVINLIYLSQKMTETQNDWAMQQVINFNGKFVVAC